MIAPGVPEGARVRRRHIPRPRPRVLIALVALAGVLGGTWLWLRDSSLVSVDRVVVTGASGPDAARIGSALSAAARGMTTLDVRMDRLRTAIVPYSVVRKLEVSTQFPHGMRIRVVEHAPVAAVVAGRHTIAVAGDGTLLHDVLPSPALPSIPVPAAPAGKRLRDPEALRAVALLAAAPYQLLAHVSEVTTVAVHGLVAQLRGGPAIYFGGATQAAAKWRGAIAVLTDAGAAGAGYIDVSDPARPATGAGKG